MSSISSPASSLRRFASLLRELEEFVELAEADARHDDEARSDRHQCGLCPQDEGGEPEAADRREELKIQFFVSALRLHLYGC